MRNKHSRVPDSNSFKTHSGDTHHLKFSSHFRPDGTIELRESGRVNIQDEINSHAVETDIALIVSRLQMGDFSVLNKNKPLYGDFTQFPKTYAEILELNHRAENAFESLPVELKNKYDNDLNKWFSAIGSEDWLVDMGLIVTPDNSESEVTE